MPGSRDCLIWQEYHLVRQTERPRPHYWRPAPRHAAAGRSSHVPFSSASALRQLTPIC